MNVTSLQMSVAFHRASRPIKAEHELAARRGWIDLEPLHEPLEHLTITGFELAPGLCEERKRILSLDWPAFVVASAPLEAYADKEFYEWLDGMNLRYEAQHLNVADAPSDWYVTRKVALLAKLTFGGAA